MAILEVIVGDITRVEVDAIVNAAKPSLMGGGGVDGAIHAAAGPALAEACVPLAPCPTGEARVTPAFNLPAQWVIHTVGPVWRGGGHGEHELLISCYRNSLVAAQAVGARTVVFPGISTGIYGFPVRTANSLAAATIQEFLESEPDAFDAIQLIWLTEAEAALAREALA